MTRSLLCTAEPFGYGPSSSLAQIVPCIDALQRDVEGAFLGQAHTLDFAARMPVYGGRVEECAVTRPDGRARFVERCRGATALLSACDFAAAAAAKEAGTPFVVYDPIAWYWPEIPAICRDADLYLCQDFFGVRERLAQGRVESAVVVPPLTPAVPPARERRGTVISLGGLGNPYFTRQQCADYAGAVLRALHRALRGRGPVLSLTSKEIAGALPGLDVATLTPAEVHGELARAELALLTPGLGQIYEASALGTRAIWLPPANDSQGRQMMLLRRRGMAPGAVDWHDFGFAPVDYGASQPAVMGRLAANMERLLRDADVGTALTERVRERMEAVLSAPDRLPRLTLEFGRDGARIAGRIVDRWLRHFDRRTGRPAIEVRDPLPPFPTVVPLTVPRENTAGTEVLEPLRQLHHEIDGTGFNTLAATLELCREVREETAAPSATDFALARERLRITGPMLFDRYRGAHCTGLAEVLRARIQAELGLTARILCVCYAHSKVPLELEWDYDGTVHTDVLVPYVDAATGGFRAVQIVNGMGIREHFHVVDSVAALLARLRDLRYTLAEVVDPAELTRKAFGCKNRLWIVKGPIVDDASEKLGVDLIAGRIFLNGPAAGAYRGPRPDGGKVAFDVASAPAAFLEAVREQFAQPDCFVADLRYLGQHLDAYCDAVLCEPGRSMRKGR